MLRAVTLIALASGTTWADTGISVGPRGGVAFGDPSDPYVGAAVHIAVPTSPFVVEPMFDCFFDDERTLYQLGGNLLYDVLRGERITPYVGIGLTMTSFAFLANTPGVDGEGYRVGTKLVAGARADLGRWSPYVRIEKGIGEFDALHANVGLAIRLREQRGTSPPPEPPRLAVAPYIANNVLGDVQPGRAGLGIAVTYRAGEHLAFELDGEAHGHFFRDRDVANLVPTGVDLNTRAVLATAGVVVPYCVRDRRFGTTCPYATAGAGAIHAVFDGFALMAGAQPFAEAQTNLALAGGAGITHVFTRRIGFRADARYFRALVDEAARGGGYFKDYGFLRLSAGVSIALL